MKARPILFSGAMVRALLDGTKTQTRRVVKAPRAGVGGLDIRYVWPLDPPAVERWRVEVVDMAAHIACPYGVPGDRLWVKETWQAHPSWVGVKPSMMTPHRVAYRATHEEVVGGIWRPSIFMPRWASRITLEVTEVRAQRLRDITPGDAEAEGIRYDAARNVETRTVVCPLVDQYAALWDSINGAGSWALDHWVWCISFARVIP